MADLVEITGLITKIKGITLYPKKALPKYFKEKATMGGLILAVILASLPVLVVVSLRSFSLNFFFVVQFALTIIIYAITLAIAYVVAIYFLTIVGNRLGNVNLPAVEWGKVLVYSTLPVLSGAVLCIVPVAGNLLAFVVSFYSLYLLHISISDIRRIRYSIVIILLTIPVLTTMLITTSATIVWICT